MLSLLFLLCSIVVAAPNGTAVNAAVSNTGVVFECPLTQGPCSPLRGNGNGMDRRLYDTDGGCMISDTKST